MDFPRSIPNRHRSTPRGVFMPASLPRSLTRNQRFDSLVLESYDSVLQDFGQRLDSLDLAVDFIPRMRQSQLNSSWSDDVIADGPVPLARLLPAGVDPKGKSIRPRMIIFRMPIEARAEDEQHLREILDYCVLKLSALYLNEPPEIVAPEIDWNTPPF